MKRKTHVDADWAAFQAPRQDRALDEKRRLVELDRQRAGYDDDWRLRVAMLREKREQEASEIALARANAPGARERYSRVMKKAWADGKFANRKERICAKKTARKVRAALAMREAGLTYSAIAERLGVTDYTAARWCGWERKPAPTNRVPVEVNGVRYASQREAHRATGIARGRLRKLAKCGPRRA